MSLGGSSSSRIRYGHPTFHSTRLQLICRDNQLRFRGGKTGLDGPLQLTGGIAVNGPFAVRAVKKVISPAMEFSFVTGLDLERASYEPLLHIGLDASEGFSLSL